MKMKVCRIPTRIIAEDFIDVVLIEDHLVMISPSSVYAHQFKNAIYKKGGSKPWKQHPCI